ncbi:hypothetical protein [Marinomonas sp. GJ51-6]|uniref:hypothetical protein n=1 Tax=Marinomonas sp. GJ51-6 TaxID=2992802 RepID=UPI0029341A8A|nr:hypothetical protein [Marinomonas sp. GJ51-6]WOD07705.1 hypothetical protein ONZ50_00495 [Marinomonas sp. GJ51-6]
MMIVDLIDEVDFIEKLKSLGVPVEDDMQMTDVQARLHAWLQDYPEQRPFVAALFNEIQGDNISVLPEVASVIKSIEVAFSP